MEDLELFEIIKCLGETQDELNARRGRTTRDLDAKGTPFEDWIMKQIESKADIVVEARNRLMGNIPLKEYEKAKKTWAKRLSTLQDIIIKWSGRKHIIIEAGYRKSLYFSPNRPQCECEEWNDNHVSLPQYDVERYSKIHKRFPNIPYYIIIGQPQKLFAIVKLEEWIKNAYTDYNNLLPDNQNQSVLCLTKTSHLTDLETWIKEMKMPLK
jgi:hypothetical protein